MPDQPPWSQQDQPSYTGQQWQPAHRHPGSSRGHHVSPPQQPRRSGFPLLNWAKRHKIISTIASVLVALIVIGGISSAVNQNSTTTSSSGKASGVAQNFCYITLSGTVTEYASVDLANGQDCGTIAFAVQQLFAGATVSSDGSTKPFPSGYSAACMGTLTAANDPATVIGPDGSDPGGACNTLGFGAIP